MITCCAMTTTRPTSAYGSLLRHLHDTCALVEAAHLLRWDQETMMPSRGAAARADELAALETVIHERQTAPSVLAYLAELNDLPADPVARANIREAQRLADRAKKMPAALVAELARTTSQAQGAWVEAKKNKRFSDFAPMLGKLVRLKREQAQALGFDGSPYDALVDEFEPGARTAVLAELFGRLRPRLSTLLRAIVDSGVRPPELGGPFPAQTQLGLARELAARLGYDFEAGRLDIAAHPFTSGGVPGDVRITTRVRVDTFEDCLYSTIHEVGHALYEQGIDPALRLQPAGGSVSMGIHESQSRLFENQVGRSRAFVGWLFEELSRAFPDLGPKNPEALYAAINRVQPSFIRTEADEVTYNLHVILRFDIERALIEGDLPVDDLPPTWSSLSQEYLGISPPDDAVGVLQDIHWAAGCFGYFPTYTLGNIYSAELFAAAENSIADLDGHIARCELAPLLAWLRSHIHRHGKVHNAQELMRSATGHAPREEKLLSYLEKKYQEIYGL